MTAQERCLRMIRVHLNSGTRMITSWDGFYLARNIDACDADDSNACLLRAMAYGVKRGWLRAEWSGVGMTPYAGSARRQRVWLIMVPRT